MVIYRYWALRGVTFLTSKSIPEMIRDLRDERNLYQVDVAKTLGISQQTYSTYEKGEYDLPIRHLSKLADFYNVSADYILGRTKLRTQDIDCHSIISRDISVADLLDLLFQLNEADRLLVYKFLLLLKHPDEVLGFSDK